MLNNTFIQHGYCLIRPEYYVTPTIHPSLTNLKAIFDNELAADGDACRHRAYLKLHWNRLTNAIHVPPNQTYYQSPNSNKVDGGKLRNFKPIHQSILSLPIFKSLLAKNIHLIKEYESLKNANELTFGIHFIRYLADENQASYSSPDWLHKDDEPLVFIHLVQLSKQALGGDNLIADNQTQKVTQVIRLEKPIETLVLNKNIYHAVTPLGSRKGKVLRDVILFTVEPKSTQH